MTIVSRLAFIGIAAILGWLGWTHREASIAETPVAPPAVERDIASDLGAPPPVVEQPAPTPTQEEETTPPTPAPVPPPAPRPVARNIVRLSVPFVSQAPLRIWTLPYKEYCEEASALTLHYFATGTTPGAASELDGALRNIQAWEEEHLGTWEDTTVEEAARILREYFGHANTRVVRDITRADIVRELDAGRPVIVPARGRELDSPYFTPPGPLYHMLVVIGYDDAAGEWIVNDVGTNTKGAGQRYAYADLLDAIADWSHADGAPTGGKAMIVLGE